MIQPTIHLVFKTHLDIGFTGLANAVRRQYHAHFIPQALDTAEHFWREDPQDPKFIWTTGAWLIADYLASAAPDDARRIERAIARGLITWHALPFTTHSELMSAAVFRAGLSYAQELDQRFGRQTSAAKMTDVPGHSRSLVPLLAEAGVRFLHLGVNEASPVPDVPPVFRWRADGGEEIVVMYQDSYGATQIPPGMDQGLSFAHTNDNAGPQGVSQVAEAYRQLRADYPEARLRAATLDQYGDLLWAQRASFPVVDVEIGDSWIHGIGSDPSKLSRYLAMQRVFDDWAKSPLTPARRAYGRGLAMVAEHTWGVDIKTFLRDEIAWDRPEFDRARATDPRFAFAESSWTEQRALLDEALACLAPADQQTVRAAADLPCPPPPGGTRVSPAGRLELGGWQIEIAEGTGDVTALILPGGRRIAGQDGALISYRYESYDAADVATHLASYLTCTPEWAILDHAKPGLERAGTARSSVWVPGLDAVWRDGSTLAIRSLLPAIAQGDLGGPAFIELQLAPRDDHRLDLTLVLRGKPANRMPEASFLAFAPQGATDWRFRKIGLWQAARRMARRGGARLQAVEQVEAALGDAASLRIEPHDTPLVGPSGSDFMRYQPDPPDFAAGIRFNLHNNKWGTNFPMWWGGDLAARFTLRVQPATTDATPG